MADEPSFRLRERFPRDRRIAIPGEVVARVTALYDLGRFVDAYEASRAAGPLQAWSGSSALAIASRLAAHLGAGRLSALLITRARRADAEHAAIACQWCRHLFERRGPMASWRAALEAERRAKGSWAPGDVSDLLTVRALVAGTYRDAETSAALLERARAAAPDDPWPLVTAARVAELEDRREDALAFSKEALAMRPHYLPAIQGTARLLHVAGRRDEAVALLEQAASTGQSPFLLMQWFDLVRESGEPARLLGLLDRAEALSPIRGAPVEAWIAQARCQVHARRGDPAAAAEAAARVGSEWFDALAKRLRCPDPGWKRVRLPVPAVAQAHRTCAPATLAALTAYLGRPVPQAAIVEAICYAGTRAHEERAWCEGNGFAAREFRVTREAARRLIDAGLPFALETKHVDAGHLQAVVGYDDSRETLLLQDPGEPSLLEADADVFLEAHRLTGPRGLVLVPAQDRDRIEVLDLPDAALYDLRHAAEAALARYDRAAAEAALCALDAAAPGHALGWLARISLATFDGDAVERRRAIEALLGMFPNDPRLLAWKLACLREAGRREDRIELLRQAVDAGEEPASFRRELAVESMADARTWALARRLLWSAHRLSPRDSHTLTWLANLEDRRRSQDRGLDLRRFATSLEDTDEAIALVWFLATVAAGRTEEALAWLRSRFRMHGARASAPAVTLAEALNRLSRTPEALDVLREAVRLRPEDGILLVDLARTEARVGSLADAREHIDGARATARPGTWLRADAALRRREADLPGALVAWRGVLEREPLALDAHREVAGLLAALERPGAAIGHLEDACARFPHHLGLASALLSWVREADPARAESLARRMIEIEPADAWWRRELAMILRGTGRLEEAVATATAAREIAPQDPPSHAVLAELNEELGRAYLSRDGFREAIRLDVDYAWAVSRLVDLAEGDERRREELEFVHGELLRQTTDGSGVEAYAAAARPVVPPADLRTRLAAIRDRRPDLGSAWSELARQTMDLGDDEGALRIAQEALERFPTQPQAWRDLARIRRRRGDLEGAAEAARRAVLLAPDLPSAWLDLSRHLHDAGDLAAATEVLRDALRHDPLEPSLATGLAHLRHLAGDADEAWRIAARVARDEPPWREAWDLLDDWASTEPRRDELVALARQVTRERPGASSAWVVLARVLPPSSGDERLAAVARAASLDPRMPEAYDLHAVLLARQGRFDEARAVLRSGPWREADRPVNLKGREAWLLAGQGNPKQAIARMLALLERDGSYRWGWARLAQWAEQADDTAAWDRAASALLRLAPGDPEALCRMAEVEMRRGRHARGEELLRQALARNPRYANAAWHLLQRAWTRRDASALRDLLPGAPTEGAVRWVAQAGRALAAALVEDPKKAATEAGPALNAADVPDPVADLLDTSFRKDLGPVWKYRYLGWLDRAVEDRSVGPPFARTWMRGQARARRWSAARRIDEWAERLGSSAHPAIAELLDAAATSKAAAKVVPGLIRRHEARLRADTRLWGKVGYALAASAMHAPCARWLERGEERPDAEGWILWNLALSLHALRRDREAEAVSLAVVRRGLTDQTWEEHVAVAAYGEALAGRADSARSLLAIPPLDGSKAPTAGRRFLVREMAGALASVARGEDPTAARQRYRSQRRNLREAARSVRSPLAVDRRRYAETLRTLARAGGARRPLWRPAWPRTRSKAQWFWIWLAAWLLLSVVRACGDLRRPRDLPGTNPPRAFPWRDR